LAITGQRRRFPLFKKDDSGGTHISRQGRRFLRAPLLLFCHHDRGDVTDIFVFWDTSFEVDRADERVLHFRPTLRSPDIGGVVENQKRRLQFLAGGELAAPRMPGIWYSLAELL
jgi:hypothetical protein